MRKEPKTETVSAKTSTSRLMKLERMAEIRGVSRSALIDDIIEAAVGGRILLDIPGTYDEYSTRSGAPNVTANDRIQRRMAAQNTRRDTADSQWAAVEVAASIRKLRAGINRQDWPEGLDPKEHGIGE